MFSCLKQQTPEKNEKPSLVGRKFFSYDKKRGSTGKIGK
jgi:hypothetical protein